MGARTQSTRLPDALSLCSGRPATSWRSRPRPRAAGSRGCPSRSRPDRGPVRGVVLGHPLVGVLDERGVVPGRAEAGLVPVRSVLLSKRVASSSAGTFLTVPFGPFAGAPDAGRSFRTGDPYVVGPTTVTSAGRVAASAGDYASTRAVSSVGRAPGLHPGGRWFEPGTAHFDPRHARTALLGGSGLSDVSAGHEWGRAGRK